LLLIVCLILNSVSNLMNLCICEVPVCPTKLECSSQRLLLQIASLRCSNYFFIIHIFNWLLIRIIM
jgi:hypothetical protein